MKLFKFLILITIAVAMSSCFKDDEGTGAGDAVIVTKKAGSNTVYGLSLYAYSYSSFKSVNALSSAVPGKTFTLKENKGYKTNFYYDTPEAEFTTTKPTAATISFSAVFESGATDEFQDDLTDKALPLLTIDTCEYNLTKRVLKVSWVKLTDADSYALNILDGSNPVFVTTELAKTNRTLSISATGAGWVGFTPVSGKTYTVRLLAFMYENDINGYNVQASSVAEANVVWGD